MSIVYDIRLKTMIYVGYIFCYLLLHLTPPPLRYKNKLLGNFLNYGVIWQIIHIRTMWELHTGLTRKVVRWGGMGGRRYSPGQLGVPGKHGIQNSVFSYAHKGTMKASKEGPGGNILQSPRWLSKSLGSSYYSTYYFFRSMLVKWGHTEYIKIPAVGNHHVTTCSNNASQSTFTYTHVFNVLFSSLQYIHVWNVYEMWMTAGVFEPENGTIVLVKHVLRSLLLLLLLSSINITSQKIYK